jgi:anti-anti-sigma factor
MTTQPLIAFESNEVHTMATVATDSIVSNEAINEFKEELLAHVCAHPGVVLHLDLSNVRLFSAAVLSDLLLVQQELRSNHGHLRLRGVVGNVRKIMKLTGLASMFTLEHRHVH